MRKYKICGHPIQRRIIWRICRNKGTLREENREEEKEEEEELSTVRFFFLFFRRQTPRKRSEEQGENRRKVRGDGIPRGPHYFPAVNFTQTVSHLTTVD